MEEEKNPSYLGYLQAIPEEDFQELRFDKLARIQTPVSTPGGGGNMRRFDLLMERRDDRDVNSEKGAQVERRLGAYDENKEKEFFKMTLLSVKVQHPQFSLICDIDGDKLFEDALEEGVPFFKYQKWLMQRLER